MSDLDPLVRHEMMAALMTAAADHGTTVVIASHVLAELEGSCDYLLLIGDGRVRLAGEVEDLVSAHRLVMGRYEDTGTPREFAAHTVVESRTTGRQLTALLRTDGPVAGHWEVAEPSLEELLLAHLRSPDVPPLLAPSAEPRSYVGKAKAGVAA